MSASTTPVGARDRGGEDLGGEDLGGDDLDFSSSLPRLEVAGLVIPRPYFSALRASMSA